MLWYHVKHQLLVNKMVSFLWRNKLSWQQERLARTTYILALVAHIWNMYLVTLIILLQKSDQQAKMKLSAKF